MRLHDTSKRDYMLAVMHGNITEIRFAGCPLTVV